jgi:hypothetical protein
MLEILVVVDHLLRLEPGHVPEALNGGIQKLFAHIHGATDLLMI